MRQRDSGLGWFLVGAGLGCVLATAAVMVTAELTRRRYFRDPVTGELIIEEYDPLEGIADSVQTGLHLLAGAASGVSESFTHALREKIRFGLDPSNAGGGSTAWYNGEEE